MFLPKPGYDTLNMWNTEHVKFEVGTVENARQDIEYLYTQPSMHSENC